MAYVFGLSIYKGWRSPVLRRKQTIRSHPITRSAFVTVSSQGGSCAAVQAIVQHTQDPKPFRHSRHITVPSARISSFTEHSFITTGYENI
jgi:hypothetical protein